MLKDVSVRRRVLLARLPAEIDDPSTGWLTSDVHTVHPRPQDIRVGWPFAESSIGWLTAASFTRLGTRCTAIFGTRMGRQPHPRVWPMSRLGSPIKSSNWDRILLPTQTRKGPRMGSDSWEHTFNHSEKFRCRFAADAATASCWYNLRLSALYDFKGSAAH